MRGLLCLAPRGRLGLLGPGKDLVEVEAELLRCLGQIGPRATWRLFGRTRRTERCRQSGLAEVIRDCSGDRKPEDQTDENADDRASAPRLSRTRNVARPPAHFASTHASHLL